ncbi:Uncharacterized protein APZ42_027722 [Daphnia magna]|uniref:Uncharacterized protein n=1 Tax=Daphnia magna TaxID=35525 RepID=A0A162D8G2_9CRUS|nr:Uncharacterized protein APZ42_027722 [Daphnia magna]
MEKNFYLTVRQKVLGNVYPHSGLQLSRLLCSAWCEKAGAGEEYLCFLLQLMDFFYSTRHKRRRIQKKLVTDSAFYEEDTEKYSSATASVTGASESNSGKNYSFPNNQFQDDFIAEVIDSDMNHSDAEPDSGSDEEIYYVDCEKETETFYEVEADEIFFDCKEYNLNKCELRESLASWAVQCQIPQCHVDQLLVLLKSFSDFDTSNLPKSGRTLLKTTRRTPIKVVGPGHYYHCGVEKDHTITVDAIMEIIDETEQTAQQEIPEAASLTLEQIPEVLIKGEKSESGLLKNLDELNDKVKLEISKMHEQYKISIETEPENKLAKEIRDVYCHLSTIKRTQAVILDQSNGILLLRRLCYPFVRDYKALDKQ